MVYQDFSFFAVIHTQLQTLIIIMCTYCMVMVVVNFID